MILADPPWHFATRTDKGQGKSASRHYPTIRSVRDICLLPIETVCAPDCALFLWACWPNLQDAFEVIKWWGFEYSGLAWEWLKFNPETGKFAFGAGFGTRKNLEPCLLARRGSPELLSHSVRDFIFAPRREHSRKPDEQYDRIEEMFDGPYLELFARNTRDRWISWGNEKEKFDAKEAAAARDPAARNKRRMGDGAVRARQ